MKTIQATSLSLLLASIAGIASARSVMYARQNDFAPVVNIIAGIDSTACLKVIEDDSLESGRDVRVLVFTLIANITVNDDIYII